MTDKIAEIRARHEAGAPGEMPIWALAQADADREFLLAEVERLACQRDEARAVISTLEIVGKAADDERARMQKEIERLHKAHETACLGGELLRGEVERLHAELDAMKAGFEVAWRAIGAKP